MLQQLDYRWVQTGSWITDSRITSLSWNLEGNRLLTGGDVLQLWHQRSGPDNEPEIGKFSSYKQVVVFCRNILFFFPILNIVFWVIKSSTLKLNL